MHRGVVIKVNPGQLVPTDYLALAVKQFTSCMGMAVVTKHDGKPCMIIEHAMEAPTVDKINEIQQQFKDSNRWIFLGEFPKGTLEDDIAPFRVIASGDDDLIAVMTDGEFISFDKPGSTHSADFHLMETAVGPMLAKFYNKEAGGDLGKFHEVMNDPLQETIFNNLSANRGNIHVICADDKVHSYCKGELRKAFPWGTTSQHLGFGEQAITDNKTATGTVEVGGTKLNKPRLFGAGPKASDTPVIPAKMPMETRPADAPIDDDAIKKKELEERIAKDDHAWDSPPEKARKNEGMTKAWYRAESMDSKCPNNWKEHPIVRLKHTKAEWAKQKTQTKDLKDLPKVVEAAAAQRPGTEALPIISAEETKRLHNWYAEKKPKAGAPDIQKLEKEVIPFSKAAGIPFDEIKSWDYGMKVELGTKVGVAALASMTQEFQNHVLTFEALHSKGDTKVADIVNTAKAVEPAAGAAPTKKRLFG